MPFNAGNPPTYARLFAFVDQFTQGETADRADFDTFLADLETSLNAAFTFFDGLSDNATDQRYLGLKSAAPSLRNDTSALQDGDKYISINASDFGTLYFRRTGAWVSVATAPFSAYFLTLIGSVDAAELRGLMGLGSAATSAASAFATATQGAKADSALQVPNLIGVNVTDWDTVSTTKTGFYQGDTGASNSPYSGDSFAGLYIARTATSGSLIVFGITSNRIFIRQFNTTWGIYREFAMRTTGQTGDINNFGVGVLSARFDNTATGAPTGFGTYTGMVSHYGTDTVRSQIAIIAAQDVMLVRTHDGTSWGTWRRIVERRYATPQAATGTLVDFAIPAGATEIKVMFNGVSLSGTNSILVQLGDAGGVEITGYDSGSSDSGGGVTSTAGLIIKANVATNSISGTMNLYLMNAATFTWVSSHAGGGAAANNSGGGGSKSLSAELTQVRITPTGANTFDAGTINVCWS